MTIHDAASFLTTRHVYDQATATAPSLVLLRFSGLVELRPGDLNVV